MANNTNREPTSNVHWRDGRKLRDAEGWTFSPESQPSRYPSIWQQESEAQRNSLTRRSDSPRFEKRYGSRFSECDYDNRFPRTNLRKERAQKL